MTSSPTPNKDIFCNSPWFELHIYWDGSYGMCCQEYEKLYPNDMSSEFNIKNMSMLEWYNSMPIQQVRLQMFANKQLNPCVRCYREQVLSNTSRRHKQNQKSVIFTKTNFNDSFKQSPHYDSFVKSYLRNGHTETEPIDLHVDLGNYCNLACKMCKPRASSTIANQENKWNGVKQSVVSDWTNNKQSWDKFKNELLLLPIKNIHFMGGETLLTDKFHDLVDFLIFHKRFEINFSFVTNGTFYDQSIVDKLKKFNRVGIELSIESTTKHNDYIRQGTNTEDVLKNIELYINNTNNTSITLTVRPAISLLSIGYYHTLLRFCLDKKLLVKGLEVFNPEFLHVSNLPYSVRQQYLKNYELLLKEYQLDKFSTNVDYNESNPHEYKQIIKGYVLQAISLLTMPIHNNANNNLKLLAEHCKKWDKVYMFDARVLYPELVDILTQNGYV